MKRNFFFLPALSLSAIILFSCKDEKNTRDLLVGKWSFDRQIVNIFLDGNTTSDTTYAEPGEYIEFRSDNTIITYIFGGYDSAVYEILGNDRLVIGQTDTIGIRSVFSNSLVLGNTVLNAPNDYYETFIYFFR